MMTLKIIKIGNLTGVVFPPEILERLHVEEGDTLYVLAVPGGIELTPYNPEFVAQIEITERVMHKNKDALRKLAE